MLHLQGKTYGTSPHLLAEASWDEFCFDQEVLEAGRELEREAQRQAKPRLPRPPRPG